MSPERSADPRLAGIQLCTDPYAAAEGTHVVALLTEWDEFLRTDWKSLSKVMRWPLIIDGHNILLESDVAGAGLIYRGIGH